MNKLCVLALAAAACGGGAPPPPLPAVPPPPPPSLASPVPAPVAPAHAMPAPLPDPISELPDVACSFRSQTRAARDLTPAFDVTSSPYAIVGAATIERLDIAPGGAVFVQLRAGKVRLRGRGDRILGAEISLHAARPLVLGGYFVPSPEYALRWETARRGALDVSLQHENASPRSPSANVACADISLDLASYDPMAAVPAPRTGRASMLRANTRVDLAATPGGSPVATFETNDFGEDVTILQSSGAHARVAVALREGVAFGWVPASSLGSVPAQGLIGMLGGLRGLFSGADERPKVRTVSCARVLPLIASSRGDKRVVGEIDEGAPIEVLAKDGDELPVRVSGAPVEPARESVLLVRREDIADCKGATR
jgi:hypothetical protein